MMKASFVYNAMFCFLIFALVMIEHSTCFFNEQGRLLQVEYAREAAMHGGTVLAVKGKDSVVLFSYTKSMISKIVSSRKGGSESVTVSCEDPKDEDEGPQKLRKIHNNLYVIGSGISADVSHCIRHAFLLAMKHQSTFNSDMPVRRLVTAVGESFHQRTLYPGLRPFGCSLLLIGKSQQQPERTAVTGMVDNNSIQHLFEIDSFGNVFDCDLTCIGNHGEQIVSSWCKNDIPQRMTTEEIIERGKTCMQQAIRKWTADDTDYHDANGEVDVIPPSIENITDGIDVMIIGKN